MGNPNVILLDEPTTGMDPVSRRHVWTLIQRLKKDKCIIMTTHAMEEAELLSDKLIVLNHGQVKCTGTPLQLKNMLGKGYRISMVTSKQDVNVVKSLMKEVAPSCEFMETSGDSGGMVFNLPTDKVKELGAIFSIIDSQKDKGSVKLAENSSKALSQLIKLVSDVGVSQTSLEEVFMAITAED